MSSGFFGLGERKGEFFLNNRTTYALYNNDNNIIDAHHVDNRVIQHGRNGFHPIIYSQLNSSANLTAFVLFSGHGQEVAFTQLEYGGQVSLSSSSADLEFVFIFNLNPVETVEAVQKHINFGSLL